jgi:hypothetical protein
MSEMEPTADELQGEDAEAFAIKAVPVAVEGPALVRLMPTECGGMLTVSLSTTPEQIAGSDPRRARLLLISEDQAVLVGRSRNEVAGAFAMRWPVATPLEQYHSGEVWMASQTDVTQVSVLVETFVD